MNGKHFALFLGMLFWTVCNKQPLRAQEESPQSFTIEQAVDYALKNSPRVRTSILGEEIARQEVRETVSRGLPQINGNLEYRKQPDVPTTVVPNFIAPSVYDVLLQENLVENAPGDFGTIPAAFGVPHQVNAGVTLSQLVFDGQYLTGIQASKTYAELKRKESREARVNTEAEVRKAFLRALILERNYEVVQQNMKQLDRQLYETQKLFEEGFAEELDVDRLRLAQKRLEAQINNLGGQSEVARKALKFQMGFPVGEPMALEGNPERVEQYIAPSQVETDIDYNQRVEYEINQVNQELADLDKKRWQMGYLPTLNFNAGHIQQAQRQEFNFFDSGEEWFPNTYWGFTLNVPIFDGFRKASLIGQSDLQKRQLQIQQESLEQQIELEVRQARLTYDNAYQNYQVQRENQQLARKIYRRTEKKYENGLGSSLELTTAQTDYYTAQSDYLSSLLNLMQARVDLDQALGNYASSTQNP